NLDTVRGGDAVVRGCRNGYLVAEDSHSKELYAFDPKLFPAGRFPTDNKSTKDARWMLAPGQAGESAGSRAGKWGEGCGVHRTRCVSVAAGLLSGCERELGSRLRLHRARPWFPSSPSSSATLVPVFAFIERDLGSVFAFIDRPRLASAAGRPRLGVR